MSDLKTLQYERDHAYSVLTVLTTLERDHRTVSVVDTYIETAAAYHTYMAANAKLVDFLESATKAGAVTDVSKTIGSAVDQLLNWGGLEANSMEIKDPIPTMLSTLKDRINHGVSPSTEIIDVAATKHLYHVAVQGTVRRVIAMEATNAAEAAELAVEEFTSLTGASDAWVVE